MKRKYLEELGIEKEVIDKIMAENGKDIETHKAETEKAILERDSFKGQVDSLTKAVEGYEGKTPEEYKKMVDDAKAEGAESVKKLEEQIAIQAYDVSLDKFLDNPEHGFNSSLAKKAARAEIKEKGLKFDGETLMGGADYIKSLKESDPNSFKVAEETNKPDFGKPNKNDSNTVGKENTSLAGALVSKFSK